MPCIYGNLMNVELNWIKKGCCILWDGNYRKICWGIHVCVYRGYIYICVCVCVCVCVYTHLDSMALGYIVGCESHGMRATVILKLAQEQWVDYRNGKWFIIQKSCQGSSQPIDVPWQVYSLSMVFVRLNTLMRPAFFSFLVDACTSLEQHLHVKGLFRVSGSATHIKALKVGIFLDYFFFPQLSN